MWEAVTTRQLQVFVAIVRNDGVNAAAEALYLSQSAVSQALGELERQLGVRLFERIGRRLRLNEAGRRVLPHAERLLDGLAAFMDAAREPSGALSGTLQVAASATIGTYLLPPLAARFMAANPQSALRLRLRNTRQVLDEVLHYQADIGLIEGHSGEAGLAVAPWRPDELVVITAPGDGLAQRELVGADELAANPWILRERGSGTRAVFEAAMGHHVQQMTVVMELSLHEAIKRAVRAGLGVGCLSRLAVAEELERGELAAVSTDLALGRMLSLVWHPARYRSPLWQAFRVALDSEMPTLGKA